MVSARITIDQPGWFGGVVPGGSSPAPPNRPSLTWKDYNWIRFASARNNIIVCANFDLHLRRRELSRRQPSLLVLYITGFSYEIFIQYLFWTL